MHTDLAGINLSSLKKNNKIKKAEKHHKRFFRLFLYCRAKLMFCGKKMAENMTGILAQKRIRIQKLPGQFKISELVLV